MALKLGQNVRIDGKHRTVRMHLKIRMIRVKVNREGIAKVKVIERKDCGRAIHTATALINQGQGREAPEAVREEILISLNLRTRRSASRARDQSHLIEGQGHQEEPVVRERGVKEVTGVQQMKGKDMSKMRGWRHSQGRKPCFITVYGFDLKC